LDCGSRASRDGGMTNLFHNPIDLREIFRAQRPNSGGGIASLRAIARALTARGISTARGGQWTAVQVGSILQRA
jgi:hypothetical protein